MQWIWPYFSITDFAQLNQTSVACAIGPSITSSSTDFPFQNLVLGNSFEFSAAEKHKICCLHGANMILFHIMCIVGSNDISNFCRWLLKLIVQWSSLWGLRASPAVLGMRSCIVKLDETNPSMLVWVSKIGFGSAYLLSLRWLVKGATALCTWTKECTKYDVTAAQCFWLVHHNDSSRWFAISSPQPTCCPVFFVELQKST